jgi:hypothetical protein
MNQSVMVFSNSTARAAALTAPTEGMLTWLEDVNRYEFRNGSGAWVALSNSGILQVVSTAKTDTFTTTSSTFADITGFSVNITPSSTSSKILVLASFNTSNNASTVSHLRLMRGATAISIGDAAGSRARISSAGYANGNTEMPQSINFLDSPATTSSTTYKIQMLSSIAGQPVHINRSIPDTDNVGFGREASSITVMEVAG